MRVAITGGTGYVGPAVVEEILKAGHDAIVLEHKHPLPLADRPQLHRVEGDVLKPETLRQAFEGADAVVHLVAIRRGDREDFERMHVEATRNVVEAAKQAGIRRFILMSAHGVEAADTPYYRTKLEMERLVKSAGFDWTIFRPTFVSGDEEGSFDREFADLVDNAPVLPSFDGGKFRIQPVARRDVGVAFARALDRPASVGKEYLLAGPEAMTWNEYLKRLAHLRGKKRMLAPVPKWAILPATALLGPLAPASPDELRMLIRDHVGDPSPVVHDLGVELHPWEQAVRGLAHHEQA